MQIKRDLKDYTTILLWRQDGHDVYGFFKDYHSHVETVCLLSKLYDDDLW
jgi:hypothetical protein